MCFSGMHAGISPAESTITHARWALQTATTSPCHGTTSSACAPPALQHCVTPAGLQVTQPASAKHDARVGAGNALAAWAGLEHDLPKRCQLLQLALRAYSSAPDSAQDASVSPAPPASAVSLPGQRLPGMQ